MVWAPKLSQSFSAKPHSEETLFHTELARYNPLERDEDDQKWGRSWPEEIAGQNPLTSREKQVTARGENPGKRPEKTSVDRKKGETVEVRCAIRQKNPAPMLTVSARMVVLKKKATTQCNVVILRMFLEVTLTSAVAQAVPMTNE